MPGVWNPTSGATLGNAMGAIRIDTSDVERAGTVTKTTAKQITDSFNNIKGGAQGTKPALVGLANDIEKVRGELLGLSAAAGGLTAIGLTTAGNLQVARVQLSGLLGGLQKSTDYTEQLRKKAAAAGMPFNEMLKIATTLLPALKGNTAELDRYANIADRMAVLKPELGAAGAAEALAMGVASGGEELGRMLRTFKITKDDFDAAMKQSGGDLAGALDLVLNKMGATNAAADEMDKTWPETLARTKDAAGQLLATGFTPLLNTLTPLLEQGTQFAMKLQETNPELLNMAAGAIAVTAAVGPMLLVFGQVITSLETIKTLSMAGTLGKAAGVGLAVGAGILGARVIGETTGNEKLANSDLGDVVDILKQTLLVAIDWVLKFSTGLGATLFQIQNSVGQFVVSIGESAMAIANMVGRLFPDKGAEYADGAQALIDFGKSIQLTQEQIDNYNRSNEKERQRLLEDAAKFLFPEITPGAAAAGDTVGGGAQSATEAFTIEQIEAFAQFQEDLAEIVRQGNEQRLRINEQYQEAVANIEERLADMRANIAEAEKNAIDGEQKKQADYLLKREQVIEDAGQAELRAAADFAQQKERDERAHRSNLLDAASRFDALGIIREMRSYDEKRTQAEEDASQAAEQRKVELEQRLAQESEAHDREMDELRNSNREKLDTLRQEYAEEYRAAQDKLLKLRDAHTKELQDLDTKLVRERDARQRAYIEQFNSLAGALANQITVSRNAQSTMVADLKKWWTDMQNSLGISTTTPGSPVVAPPPPSSNSTLGGYTPPGYASGGRIPSDMLAYVHAGEEVIRPDVARQIRSAMGGSINQPALAMAAAGGAMGGGMSIGSIPIAIYGAAGQSAGDIGRAVEERFLDILRRYNKSAK